MDLRSYLKAIRGGWWIVVIAVFLGVSGSIVYITVTAPTYASSVTFFVNTTPDAEDNPLRSGQYAQQRVTSYVQLLSSERLAQMVLDDTKLEATPREVSKSISGTSPLNTVLLTATVQSTSFERSRLIAESISTQFVQLIKDVDSTVRLQVTSGPSANPTPIAPRKKLDVTLGFLAGLVIGAVAAVSRELLDNTVRSTEALRSATGLAVLGSIGRDAKAKKSPLVVGDQTNSARAEAFRRLRTNLQFVDVARQANIIVVTSALPGEGKSVTAANLAVIYAEAERQVLLVEGDLRRSGLSDYLGIESAVGLTNVLAGQVQVDDVLQRWGDGGLTVLPKGSTPPNPSELLGSSTMTTLLQELRKKFDTIIIDTPPLLPVTDAAVAAVQADGALLVVCHGKTTRQQLSAAIGSLESVDARILGCVLNMVQMRRTDAYLVPGMYSNDDDEPLETTTP